MLGAPGRKGVCVRAWGAWRWGQALGMVVPGMAVLSTPGLHHRIGVAVA